VVSSYQDRCGAEQREEREHTSRPDPGVAPVETSAPPVANGRGAEAIGSLGQSPLAA
jgi:hypothetical protein